MATRRRASSSTSSAPPITIDAREFTQLLRDAKAFDRDLGLRLRRNLRTAAKPIVADVKRTVMEPTPTGGRGSYLKRQAKRRGSYTFLEDGESVTERFTYTETERTTVRREIGRGIGLRIGVASRGAAVTIAASGRNLPEKHRPMLRLYNKRKGWRHPIFGRGRWVAQQGRPFFGAVIIEHRVAMQKAVLDAMDEAARALARKNP